MENDPDRTKETHPRKLGTGMRFVNTRRTICEVLRECMDLSPGIQNHGLQLEMQDRLLESVNMAKRMSRKLYEYCRAWDSDWWDVNGDYEADLLRRTEPEMETMTGRWNYDGLGQVQYGDVETYRRPMEWLDEIGGQIQDWGCGCAYAKQFCPKSRYLGIDGSQNDYADLCGVDLSGFVCTTDCIFLRDVLDHNVRWPIIVNNAVKSVRHRIAVVVFLPLLTDKPTQIVNVNTDPKYPGVPDIQFNRNDLVEQMRGILCRSEQVIGNATIFYLQKP